MNLKLAKELAAERGYRLVEGYDHGIDLEKYDQEYGQYKYIDTLHLRQIGELKESDFIEYYLNND